MADIFAVKPSEIKAGDILVRDERTWQVTDVTETSPPGVTREHERSFRIECVLVAKTVFNSYEFDIWNVIR